MHMITVLSIVSLALGSLGRTVHDRSFRSRRRQPERVPRAVEKTWVLEDLYQGKSFLENWNYMVGADPTHGNVNYVDNETAVTQNLVYIQDDGATVLAVDDTTWLPQGANRNSVRISSNKTYNGGLFIADFYAMPHGCSIWPAYWSVGPGWPNGGEIDILEGVHNQETNQYTVHTGPDCQLTTQGLPVLGQIGNLDCASGPNGNAGCYFTDEDTTSYGMGFNLIAGGVFVHLLDPEGVKIWRFPRTAIPDDITAQTPDPSGWGPPTAFWSASSCDTASHFYDHVLVLDTTLCGDWGEPTYSGAGCPGTCAEAVMDPTNYTFAKWKINYIAVYQ